MYEAQFATGGRAEGREWDICRICGFSFPKDQIHYVNNAPYCVRYKHYLDAPGV